MNDEPFHRRPWPRIRAFDVSLVVVVALGVWFVLDVGPRARVVPGLPELHKTDFSVYTGAAAAFFDGRDPYAVTSPRGWYYLYPPLFALCVAPLTALSPYGQALAWFALSVAFGFGSVQEIRRLWRRWIEAGEVDPTTQWLVGVCAGLTALLPTLECLQRGQLGVAILYMLLLGFRLATGPNAGGGRAAAGGLALAWAAVAKLVPTLPAFYLVGQAFLDALRSPTPGGWRRAGWLGLGTVGGLALFLFAAPALVLGWGENLTHLRTWAGKVVTNVDPGQESKFHIDSSTNQSASNAAHSLAIHLRPAGPDDPRTLARRFGKTPDQVRFGVDTASARLRRADTRTHRLVAAGQALALLALLAVALRTAGTTDPTLQAARFGLAALATLVVSPVAWTHYYMAFLPAVPAVPIVAAQAGRVRLARALAVCPAALVLAHYLAKPLVGPVGLLGLGTAAWYFGAAALLCARVARPVGVDRRCAAPSGIMSGRAATAQLVGRRLT